MPQLAADNVKWARVDEIWAEYERTHNLTGTARQAVGIDPETGEVFLGESAADIVARLKQEGRFRPLYYRWSDDPYYTHKGGRR